MTRRELQVGDEIEADVLGQRFRAIVEDLDDPRIDRKPIRVQPLSRRITWRWLSPRQVVRRVHRGPRQLEIVT